MFKRGLASLPVLLLASIPLFAQDSHSKKPKDCAGTISADGESFTCDKDTHVWKVSNPAALQNMEGHHVQLSFRATSTDEALVLTASTIQEHTVKPGDSAFRR
jgi:hypothetical protein